MAVSRSASAWASFFATRLVGAAVDAAVLAVAYFGAHLLRLDFGVPRCGWGPVATSCVVVTAAHLVALVACGCYRQAWRRMSLRGLRRYVLATLLAAAAMTVLRFCMPFDSYWHLRPPYSVTVITFVLATCGLVAWRIVWSWLAMARVRETDLLEREVRRLDTPAAADYLRGKTVMVTGAGGSIGSEIVRQIARSGAKRLVLVERCENALYEIDRELRTLVRGACPHVPLMVDVNDGARMDEVFAEYAPEVVLHAAAYKHVPMVEENPREGERNNTVATAALAALSERHGVRRFVMISTDKAVNPVSVMGRTKLAAERAIMAMNREGSKTSFCAVRFGNVLGSSGSVVPLFREQIARGGPVTVTDREMRRYFMSVGEAVGLVLQAASRTERAVYTLDMGEPVRIVDLAEDMIRQAGYKPYVDIDIVFSGIRPGEKLFEELDISERSAYRTDMAKIYVTRDQSQGANDGKTH